jgi:hypothetical protein
MSNVQGCLKVYHSFFQVLPSRGPRKGENHTLVQRQYCASALSVGAIFLITRLNANDTALRLQVLPTIKNQKSPETTLSIWEGLLLSTPK